MGRRWWVDVRRNRINFPCKPSAEVRAASFDCGFNGCGRSASVVKTGQNLSLANSHGVQENCCSDGIPRQSKQILGDLAVALVTSKLKDRLAEALTITVSILLAFAIDAWWDGVQETNLDRAHLASVLRELETTSDLLDDAIRLHGLTMDKAETVLEMTSKGELVGSAQDLDGLINDLFNSYQINAPTGALRAAILSGAIARIHDQELKSLLLGWEGLIDDLLEEEINGFENAAIFTRWLGEHVSLHGPASILDENVSGEKTGLRANHTLPPSGHTAGVAMLLEDMAFENQILLLHMNGQSSHDEAVAFQEVLDAAISKLIAINN